VFSLDGKKAIVTGGASGIGEAVVDRFTRAGADVAVIDLADARGIATFRADVSDESGFRSALGAAGNHLGGLDILVNNAGIQPLGPPLAQTTGDLLDRTLSVNVRGVLHGLRFGPPLMPDGSRILNTASFLGTTAAPLASGYGVSKAAVVYLTRVAALELAPRRITVNCICPGTVRTPAVTGVPDNPEVAWIERTAPLRRTAEPEEVAAMFHYLASDEAGYVTGQAMVIDGGMTCGLLQHEVVPPPQVRDGRWVDAAAVAGSVAAAASAGGGLA
jgi:NAD(P)-dependent dehydrogenase (short-subunit alcohol dehydrogenase family)